jgi:ubiquinone/menaquinone biosynthesis C-methylase UbiE
MPRLSRHALITVAVLSAVGAALLAGQSARDNAADADRLVAALGIRAGSTVADIGAGSGELTVLIAEVVGETGRVFSTEIDTSRLRTIEKAVDAAGLRNVTVTEGRPAETNLPEECCDAIFMRNVYHHFGDPPAMNGSLYRSLKADGRLAVIDFTPPPGRDSAAAGKRSEDGQHGVTASTVERELAAAGFEIVSSESTGDRNFMVVARRATQASRADGTAGTAGDSSPARTLPRRPRPE